MCESALPPGFHNQAAGTKTDWDNPIQRYWKKSWFAYGPRDKHWYHKWREMPITLFAAFGEGESRWEASGGEFALRALNKTVWFFKPTLAYLSRVQYYTRWSIQIQWPFLFAFHFYLKATDVPAGLDSRDTDGKLWFFYIGAHRDADRVYWCPSVYLGKNWK